MRRGPTIIFALGLVAAALASFGLLFFGERFPSARQREIQDALRSAGPRAVEAAGGLLSRGLALPGSAADLLRVRAPRLARLLGLADKGTPGSRPAAPPGSSPAASPAAPAAAAPAPAPRRIKTAEELRVEAAIEATFREYFREVSVGGRTLTLRMPFALNDEREGGRGYTQAFYLHGKGTPDRLWPYIGKVLASKGFAAYASSVGTPGEKAVIFNLQKRSWSVSTKPSVLQSLRGDSYPGTPTRIFVHRNGDPVSGTDVYNYLYAVASVGVDCSGFAYHILEMILRAHGVDMDRELAKNLRVPPAEVRMLTGLLFFDPAGGYTEKVADRIEELRPGDMILFRGSDGSLKHSAVVQSVDLDSGIIRYVQSTDWALEEDRGVHSSIIRFDPARGREGLRHYSVKWLQQVRPPFDGEMEPRDWRTDGDRYLWYTEAGGSMVVRFRLLSDALRRAEPRFYTAVYPGEGTPVGEQGGAPGGSPRATPGTLLPFLRRRSPGRPLDRPEDVRDRLARLRGGGERAVVLLVRQPGLRLHEHPAGSVQLRAQRGGVQATDAGQAREPLAGGIQLGVQVRDRPFHLAGQLILIRVGFRQGLLGQAQRVSCHPGGLAIVAEQREPLRLRGHRCLHLVGRLLRAVPRIGGVLGRTCILRGLQGCGHLLHLRVGRLAAADQRQGGDSQDREQNNSLHSFLLEQAGRPVRADRCSLCSIL